MMYWVSRYCAFFVAMLLIEGGTLIWEGVFTCASNCGLSNKFIRQFLVLIIFNSIIVFFVVMVITSAARGLALLIIQWRNPNLTNRKLSLDSTPQSWMDHLYRTVKQSNFLRDCIFLLVYLIAMGLFEFTPSSPGYSYSKDGQSIIVDGQYTEFGLHQAIGRYIAYCVEGFIFLALVVLFDRFVLRHKHM